MSKLKGQRPASAWFECIKPGCRHRYELSEIVYQCTTCGSLLEVVHDLQPLKRHKASAWQKLFENRWRGPDAPYGSGVWGKKEWVLPDIDVHHIVSLAEGATPLLRCERYGKSLGLPDLYIKQCGTTHTGSFKDLGMTVLVSQVNHMISKGAKIRAVACASTGDTSAALSAYCAAAGIPSVVLLPKGKISTAQLVQPLSNNSLVLSLETDFDGCMRLVREVSKRSEFYLANSMNSLRVEGQKTISVEIVQQLNWEAPDVVVIPGGNLGNVSALGKGFEMLLALGLLKKRPRIAVAQAQRANPLFLAFKKGWDAFEPVAAQKTLASAIQIGDPVSVDKAIRVLKAFDGVVEQANEAEIAEASAEADRFGLFTCPHTAVALAALKKLRHQGVVRKADRVVVISTAHGLKFTEFKVGYHENRLEGLKSRQPNQPEILPPEVDAILRLLDRKFSKG